MASLDRAPGVRVAVTPEVVRPRQAVTATITTDEPLDGVTSVTLEWGYDNFYRCHGADRVDSSCTSCGDERDTADWVCVTRVDVPVASGEFTGTTSAFTVPPWAPGSSALIARWSCRLTIVRGGRDVAARGDVTVVIAADDVDPVEALEAPMEWVSGDAATELQIVLPASVFVAGATVSGHVVLTPRADLPDGRLTVSWQRHRDSHPLARQPCKDSAVDGRIMQLGNEIPLRAGAALTLPFELALPGDAPPTADAVHSSLSWFIGARLEYAGLHGDTMERVRRPIIVASA